MRESGVSQVRVCDPAFQGIDHSGCAEAVVTLMPRPGGLHGAEEGIEMIAAGVVAKAVWRVDGEAAKFWGLLAEGIQKIAACFVLIGCLLFPCIVLVAATAYEPSGENARVSFYGDSVRIALMQMRYSNPGR